MTNRSPRNEKAFKDAEQDIKRSAEIIESNLVTAVANLSIIATALPGHQPLKAEIDLLKDALSQAKRLHTEDGIEQLLKAHEQWQTGHITG